MGAELSAQILVDALIADNLKGLKPYESARRLFSGGQDWLNANESPYANEYELDDSRFNRYPDCQPPAVIEGYARYAGVSKDQLICTRGADEGIELLIRTFCTPGKDSVLICPPTYGMYAISAETCNVGIERAPLKADFSLDLDAIFAFKGIVNLVFICSPNNPTGTVVNKDDLRQVLEHFGDSALVVVDEAYIEFDLASQWASELGNYANLVILRTLSKAFALAGIRCGFTLANAPVIAALMKTIAPYPIPEPVAQIATQALSNDGLRRLATQVQSINADKAGIKAALALLPVELVGDDKGNFILFRTPLKQALMDNLVSQGILIRDQSKQLNLENCLRITVGSDEQNARLLAAMACFFAAQEQAS